MCPDFTSLTSSIDLSNITSSFGGLARTYCPAWDGTGLRYYQSALCGYFVGFGFAQGPSTGGPKCNPSNTTFTLCASTMTKYVAAWTKLFSNPTLCPKNDLVSYASGYSRNSAVLSSSATCIVGEGKDTSNCGMLDFHYI
ncbi:hypothetical protein BC830DRAFT_964567 [Chytriomyces sp. MP71]|nr:hypothetical protein BC830DRAFT_964567 [Chytriomyces sp. MP71]